MREKYYWLVGGWMLVLELGERKTLLDWRLLELPNRVNEWNYFLILNIYGSIKTSIYEVDGCRDRISLWGTAFRHLHEGSQWNLYTEFKLKRSVLERMWHNWLSEYLIQKGYSNIDDCPCIFIKRTPTGFCIMYVDDLNIIGNTQDIDEACSHLKTEFDMKDLGKTKFCLGLKIEHLQF